MHIKKIFVQFIAAGKPTIPHSKGVGAIFRYCLRYVVFGLLYGCSLGYRTIVQLRLKCYQHGIFERQALPCPVISVGNITTGGTGKTPLVILIAQILQQHGQRVAILSRGYRRAGSAGILPVFPSWEGAGVGFPSALPNARLIGDEPLLIARKFRRGLVGRGCNPALPVVIVGKKRAAAGKLAFERFHPDVMLLDDGFQHLQLQRACDLVLIDATQPFGGNYLLPAGFLREPVENLTRAHAFVITRSDEAADLAPLCQRLRQINPAAPIFRGRHVFDELRQAGTEERLELARLQGKRLLSVSGVGNPASFQRLLAQLGVNVVKTLDFPDHHWYAAQDLAAMQQAITAGRLDALVTTEKDEAKLALHADFLGVPIYVIAITIEVQPQQEFEQLLLALDARSYRKPE